jgi:hypothetical protein
MCRRRITRLAAEAIIVAGLVLIGASLATPPRELAALHGHGSKVAALAAAAAARRINLCDDAASAPTPTRTPMRTATSDSANGNTSSATAVVAAAAADTAAAAAATRTADKVDAAFSHKGKAPMTYDMSFVTNNPPPLYANDCSMSVGILTHDEFVFEKSMLSWDKAGIFDIADEVLFFLNKRSLAMELVVDHYRRDGRNFIVLGSTENVAASTAFISLVRSARRRFFLFLEHDFRAVEPLGRTLFELGAGMDLMNSGVGVSLYLRSRNCAGYPNYAQESLTGKEHLACAHDERFFSHACYMWHWRSSNDLLAICPSDIRPCTALGNQQAHDPPFLCVPSGACAFSQNPSLFLRDPWFADIVREWDSIDWAQQHPGPDTPFSHIENYMSFAANLPGAPRGMERKTGNLNPWAAMNKTVILGQGLFRHDDFVKHGNTNHSPCELAGVPDDVLRLVDGRLKPPAPPHALSPTRCKDALLLRFLDHLSA